MNCKDLGYEVGQVFKKVKYEKGDNFSEGAILVLTRDDDSEAPYFTCIDGHEGKANKEECTYLYKVRRIWPTDKIPFVVDISDDYEGQIYSNGTLEVGCQKIPFEKIEEIYNLAKKQRGVL